MSKIVSDDLATGGAAKDERSDKRSIVLLFATRNAGKVAELVELTRGVSGLEVRSIEGLDLAEVEETGTTFSANAALKALAVSRATGLPALADDSGLEVDALGGAPGVFSARYAGEHANDAANNEKLLHEMTGVSNRSARFRSVLALADTQGALGEEVLLADGACEGEITTALRGDGGFGYDPLFYFPALDATFAEIGVGPKNDLSHRAQAFSRLLPKLIRYFGLINSK